jgi:hypothetical protein
MFFVASPDHADRMICLLCQAKHVDDPKKCLVAQGDGKHNCNVHMKSAHGLDMERLVGVGGQMTLANGLWTA